ncbi:MAG: recombinase RecA [Actinobacteria bacterium]|nr:recombinase RecA [Actinomycetota bacterium]
MAKSSNNQEKRSEALDRTIAQIEKSFGKGSIMQLADQPTLIKEGISTGALSLDLALGGAGMPRGRIVELYGPESSGKTTLALHVISNAQKTGGVAAFIDAEHSFDTTWAKRLGVDTDHLLFSQPDYGEQALNITEMLVRSNALDVIVVDSVAALIPKSEIDGEIGDVHVGLQARLMSQAMRKLAGVISKSRACVIFINQIREKIGVMFGSPETTPGGRALKFYASIRLDIRRVTTLKQGDQSIGTHVRARVVKSKISPPFKRAEFDILFDEGISYYGDLLGLALENGLATKSGSWLNYGQVRLGQGQNVARKFLQDNPDLAEEIRAKVLALHGPKADPEKTPAPAPKPAKKSK